MILDKLLSYYNLNKCTSDSYELKDLINGYDGVFSSFNNTKFNNDEEDKYIEFLANYNQINIPKLNNSSKIKGISTNIYITGGTGLFCTNKLYIVNGICILDNSKRYGNQGLDYTNKRVTFYFDLVNDKVYFEGKDVTSTISMGSWTHDPYSSFQIGNCWYRSFSGKLYNLAIYNDALTEQEIKAVFKNRNYISMDRPYYLINYKGKYFYNDYDDNDILKYLDKIDNTINDLKTNNHLYDEAIKLSLEDNNKNIPIKFFKKFKICRVLFENE